MPLDLIRWVKRQDSPPVCYSACNNTLRIARGLEKTPELCREDGDFMAAYETCTACFRIYRNSTDSLPGDYVIPEELGQYLEYCFNFTFVTITLTFYVDGNPTTDAFVVEAPQPTLADSTTPTASADSTTTTAESSTTTTKASSLTGTFTPPPGDKASSSNAWIAGPVVGSVVALGLLPGAAFWLRQRRRKTAMAPVSEPLDESYGKAQLHSDDIPKPVYPTPELHPDSIHEMEGSRPEFREAEKPANETPARELPTNETAAQRAGHDGDEGHPQTATT